MRPRKPLIVLIYVCWILLNLIAQASIAVISLIYSFDYGVDSRTIATSSERVSVPRIDCYYKNKICTTDPDQLPKIA